MPFGVPEGLDELQVAEPETWAATANDEDSALDAPGVAPSPLTMTWPEVESTQPFTLEDEAAGPPPDPMELRCVWWQPVTKTLISWKQRSVLTREMEVVNSHQQWCWCPNGRPRETSPAKNGGARALWTSRVPPGRGGGNPYAAQRVGEASNPGPIGGASSNFNFAFSKHARLVMLLMVILAAR